MTFGERLASVRKAKGKSMQEMADLLGISAPGYKRLEDGTGAKTFEKLPIIAKALGCRVDDLFPDMDRTTSEAENKTVSADGFASAKENDDDSLDCLVL